MSTDAEREEAATQNVMRVILELETEKCPRCRGGALQGYQDCDGPCDGSGYICKCIECGVVISAPEAEEHGCCCSGCRVELDASDEEVAAGQLRRSA